MGRTRAEVSASANHARYQPGQRAGFYESYFMRANHPTRPLAFWVRYTIFSPEGHPEAALGELWGIFFDGETGQHTAAKSELPFAERCSFDRDGFSVAIGDARLSSGRLSGAASSGGSSMRWDLTYRGGREPLLLFPPGLYDASLPKAKALVGAPMAVYRGTLRMGDREVEVADWVGSQAHNWGTKHTDQYVWGQVAGFDDQPESFLEVATGRLKIGPVWTPSMTLLVLSHRGEELALNSVVRALRARATCAGFHWSFRSEDDRVAVEGTMTARPTDLVGLAYRNPPTTVAKHCLNTKIAACELTLRRKRFGRVVAVETFRTAHRAAFEILTDDRDHGIAIRA